MLVQESHPCGSYRIQTAVRPGQFQLVFAACQSASALLRPPVQPQNPTIMKTDTLFYRLFQRWPKLALELLGLDYAGDSYKFGSEEIKQTAFRLDGVFTPLSDAPEQPIIFAEVQYQPDIDFYGRFISEITLYLRLHKPGRRWMAFVIYPTRSAEKPPSIEFEPFLYLPQLRRIYLEDYQDQQGLSLTLEFIRLIISSESQAVDLARKLVERRAEIGPDIIDFIETILVYKLPTLTRQEIIAMLTLDNIELKQTRFYQEIAQEEGEKGRQIGRQEGRQIGRQEGRQEGRLIGRQETWLETRQKNQRMVARMMRHKFDSNPAVQQAEQQLPMLDAEQLEELAEALLDLTDTQALTRWLAAKLA